jgi:hypothetical protein
MLIFNVVLLILFASTKTIIGLYKGRRFEVSGRPRFALGGGALRAPIDCFSLVLANVDIRMVL